MPARPLAVAALFTLFAASAQAGAMSVPLNHSVRLPLAGPAQSVVVGSPAVIDVAVVDSRTVFVSGKAPGSTDVTVIDPLGRVVFRGDVSVAGGAPVSIFRGAAQAGGAPSRTDATCTPACRDLTPEQSPSTSVASVGASGAPGSAGAGALGAGAPLVSPQAISSIPAGMGLLHR